MTAYSFKKQFAEPILAGTKAQTIRAERKGRSRHARPGEALQLYTGMRTKYCRLIGRATCAAQFRITLRFDVNRIVSDQQILNLPSNLDRFAANDGFADWAAMKAFWAKEHPDTALFEGVLIRWTGFVPG